MPWYHGWNVLAVGLVFQAVSFGIGIYCFTFWVAPWSAEFGVGRGEVMTVFLGMQVAMGALAPFAGRAMDRFSIRALICCGALSLALALFLAGRATALWQLNVLYATLVVGGMLLAGPLPAQTLAARWFTRRRGLALGISTIGTSIGGFLLPPLVTALQAGMGWREANDVLALIVIVAVLPLTWLVVRNSPQAAGRPGEAEHAPGQGESAAAAAHAAKVWTVGAVLKEPAFWFMVAAFTLMTTAFGGVQQNLAPYALDLGIDATAAAWLVSVMALVMVGGKVFFGGMADRIDIRWLFGLAMGVLALALTWMSFSPAYLELGFICAMLGFAAAAQLPLLAALVSRRFGVASFGLVMGLVGPFTTLGATGPWIAGYLRDTSGSYDLAWLALGLLLIPAVVAMLWLRPVGRRA